MPTILLRSYKVLWEEKTFWARIFSWTIAITITIVIIISSSSSVVLIFMIIIIIIIFISSGSTIIVTIMILMWVSIRVANDVYWSFNGNTFLNLISTVLAFRTIFVFLQVFDFIVQKLYALRKPKTNIQILQQNVLLKYK